MSKFKNLVDQLRKKRLEGVVSVEDNVSVVETKEEVVEEKQETTEKPEVNTSETVKKTRKRKGK